MVAAMRSLTIDGVNAGRWRGEIERSVRKAAGRSTATAGGSSRCVGRSQAGTRQGEMMTDENAGKYGHGPHKDEKYRYTSIEQKISGIRKWYDKVRCDAARSSGQSVHV